MRTTCPICQTPYNIIDHVTFGYKEKWRDCLKCGKKAEDIENNCKETTDEDPELMRLQKQAEIDMTNDIKKALQNASMPTTMYNINAIALKMFNRMVAGDVDVTPQDVI